MCLPPVDGPVGPKLLGGFAPNMLLPEPKEVVPCEPEPCVLNIELPVLLGLLPKAPPLPKLLAPVPPKAPNPDDGLGAPNILGVVDVVVAGPNVPVGW